MSFQSESVKTCPRCGGSMVETMYSGEYFCTVCYYVEGKSDQYFISEDMDTSEEVFDRDEEISKEYSEAPMETIKEGSLVHVDWEEVIRKGASNVGPVIPGENELLKVVEFGYTVAPDGSMWTLVRTVSYIQLYLWLPLSVLKYSDMNYGWNNPRPHVDQD